MQTDAAKPILFGYDNRLKFVPLQVERNDKQWKQWFDKEAPEEEVIPDGYNNSLDVFRRLLLVRCWCPDRILPMVKGFICSLGSLNLC